jgi:hypothetical protein
MGGMHIYIYVQVFFTSALKENDQLQIPAALIARKKPPFQNSIESSEIEPGTFHLAA